MKNLTTKLLVALTCVAFASVQYASANTDVLSGADIINHSGGLTKIDGAMTKDASLHFNADTKVNWGHLNVAKDEALHFLNGNNNILNVVQNGASRFAGQVTGETGKIIISNPNGILFIGGNAKGTFGGDLILTTKNLAGIEADAIKGLDANAIRALEDNGKGVIALQADETGRASITAGKDITIVANGFSSVGGQLLSENGSVLITSDGANFVLDNNRVALKDDKGNDVGSVFFGAADGTKTPVYMKDVEVSARNGNINIEVKDNSSYINQSQLAVGKDNSVNINTGNQVYIKDSNVEGNLTASAQNYTRMVNSTVTNGDVSLSGTRVQVNNDKVNGNLTVVDTKSDFDNIHGSEANKDNYVRIYNTTVDKNLSVNADNTSPLRATSDPVYMSGVTAKDSVINGYQVKLDNVNLGNTDINSYGVTSLSKNSVINGDLNITTNSEPNIGTVWFGSNNTTGDPTEASKLDLADTLEVKGNMTIDSGSTVGIAANVTVDGNANITTHNSTVIVAYDGDKTYTLDADTLTINAPLSINKLYPVDGATLMKQEIKEGDNKGQTKEVSQFYYYMQGDHVVAKDPTNPDNPDNPDVPGDEPEKNITNLVINGVDTSSAQTFTPIAFAADDEPDNVKRIAKIVFKTPDGVVSISDRLIQKDINSSF